MPVNNSALGQSTHKLLIYAILCLIVVAVGFGRIEDRAIIALPQLTASTMAAISVQPTKNEEYDNAGADDDVVFTISDASQLSKTRTSRVLRERSIAAS